MASKEIPAAPQTRLPSQLTQEKWVPAEIQHQGWKKSWGIMIICYETVALHCPQSFNLDDLGSFYLVLAHLQL